MYRIYLEFSFKKNIFNTFNKFKQLVVYTNILIYAHVMEEKSNELLTYKLHNEQRTPGWDHFNDNFLSQSLGHLDNDTQARYKNMGDKFLGYDINNVENIIKEDAVLLSSTGKKIDLNDEYHVKQLVMCIQNGLELEDITPDELALLKKQSGTKNNYDLIKWISLQ